MAQIDALSRWSRCSGVAVPLFSLRSDRDRGIGDILDLLPMLRWAARMGQRVVQVLPLQETTPGEASPYAALSAFGFDPLYVRTAAPSPPPAAAGESLPREAVREAKLAELEAAWRHFRGEHGSGRTAEGARLAAFIARERRWLDDYALFRALKERQQWRPWREWPAGLREREAAAIDAARVELAERIAFFQYVQWSAVEQWEVVRAEARRLGIGLMGDLPFAIREDSADFWSRPHLITPGWEIGAPPDEFSAEGQNWGLPLYDWPRQRADGFAWWRARIRHACAHFDLFRIDHIVGVFRTYAIGLADPAQRRFHPEAEHEQIAQGGEFLAMMCEETGEAVAVAEDLGTIPPFVRAALAQQHVPGYKVLRWEKYGGHYRPPRDYDPLSVATTGTHDTSTLAAWWTEISTEERRGFLADLDLPVESDWAEGSFTPELRRLILERLYCGPSLFVILPIQDLFGWRERINVPKTESAANWNYRLPFVVADDGGVPAAVAEESGRIAALVRAGGRSP